MEPIECVRAQTSVDVSRYDYLDFKSRRVVCSHRRKQRLCTFPLRAIQPERGSTGGKKQKNIPNGLTWCSCEALRDRSVRETGVQSLLFLLFVCCYCLPRPAMVRISITDRLVYICCNYTGCCKAWVMAPSAPCHQMRDRDAYGEERREIERRRRVARGKREKDKDVVVGTMSSTEFNPRVKTSCDRSNAPLAPGLPPHCKANFMPRKPT